MVYQNGLISVSAAQVVATAAISALDLLPAVHMAALQSQGRDQGFMRLPQLCPAAGPALSAQPPSLTTPLLAGKCQTPLLFKACLSVHPCCPWPQQTQTSESTSVYVPLLSLAPKDTNG